MKLYTRRAADGSRSAGLGAGVRDGEAGEDAGGVPGGTIAGRAGWAGSRARVGGARGWGGRVVAVDREGCQGMADRAAVAGKSAESWRAVRAVLTANRHELGRVAARLYPEVPRAGGADLLCREEWVPAEPVNLDELALSWDGDPANRDGVRPERYAEASRGVRPQRAAGERYASSTDAVAALDRPALFENRPCYRLLDARLTAPAGLRLGETSYFEGIDLGHAVAHELAAAWERSGDAVSMADLPLRALAGDPCARPRRQSLIAVTTLTLRRDAAGSASFVLHWRDPAKVNHGGGLYQVMPVGLFQPVTSAAAARRHDLSLWKSMAREFSEEFLGTSEDYPTSGGLLD